MQPPNRIPRGFGISYSELCAVVAMGGAVVDSYGGIIIGIILNFIGLAYLCWLLFALAVYALPFFVGATAGLAAYHSGSGPIAAIIVGAVVGSFTLMVGGIAFTRLRSPLIRAALALLFAVPAAVAGSCCTRARADRDSEGWRDVIAFAGAAVVAATAWTRMAFSSAPDAGVGLPAGLTSSPVPASRTSEA